MANTKINDVVDHSKNLYPRWGWFIALGIVLIILGMGALTYAVTATLTSVIVIGVLMLIGGAAQFIHAWTLRSLSGFFWWTLVGLLYVIAGGMVIQNPIAGAEILTLLLGATLIGVGVLRLGIWLMNRGQEGWLWLAFSGVVSLVTGLLIALQWPSIGLWLLGMILGIDLLFQGWSMLWLGIALRRMRRLMQ
ncbi:HdeD family acid-resistance protein [Paenalcaligenes hominis]|uniref:HdeD family acid-resistance protein n=1 Tax=Paenalcaligenes hominis TaxID=643674 RepID=UPI0035241CB8